MFQKAFCPKCGRELRGAIETTSTNNGKYVFIVQTETSDCNWVKCLGCKTISCKECRRDRYHYCCNEGRIIDHERARAALANGHNKN